MTESNFNKHFLYRQMKKLDRPTPVSDDAEQSYWFLVKRYIQKFEYLEVGELCLDHQTRALRHYLFYTVDQLHNQFRNCWIFTCNHLGIT